MTNLFSKLPDGRMTTKAAANYLGFEEGTLANWRMKKIGPRYVKVGSRIFYYQHDLDSWLSGETEKAM